MNTVILGLGSNLGDKLGNLRSAWHAIQQIPQLSVLQVSPVYMSDALVPDGAPASWNIPYFNLALRCETDQQPLGLLKKIKEIENQIGRKNIAERWAPRQIDIDILAWDDFVIDKEEIAIPHKGLLERPFALWPLADVAPLWLFQGKTAAQLVEPWGSRFSGDAPFHTRQVHQRIDTPDLVGVINTTPDSFADGGHFIDADKAVEQAMHLVYAGATVLDLGAEATSPHAAPVDAKTSWQRLEPVLSAINAIKNSLFLIPKISIDTHHPEVAAKALAKGIDWINDVSGLDNIEMRRIVAESKVDCVVMHHLSIPERRNNVLPRDQNPVKLVYDWAERRLEELEKQGIQRERLIFDPGIGFGKMAEQSLVILQNIADFTKLNVRILVGHSRKTYLSIFTGVPFVERDIETTAISLYLAKQPINYLRLHNVEICARAFKVDAAL